MLNKLFGKLSGDSRKKGFTMTELLVVIGIIAIVCAIAIPAIISMNKSLKFKQANEYAESIFMAAQANLTEMRSDGQLINLLTDGNGAKQIPDGVDFPEDHVANYRYATSEDAVYDILVPKMSVDSEVRDGNVLIEYNPFTGNVYAVFYKDGGETLSYDYVTRDEDARRDLLLGYYCGSALSTEPLTPEETEAEVNFVNGEEGIVEVSIPIPKSYKSRVTDFANGIAVDLTIEGRTLTADDRNGKSGKFTTQIKQAEPTDNNWKWDAAENKIIVSYTLDSLMDKQSFANYCQLDGDTIKKAPYAHVQARSASNEAGTKDSLTAIADEKVFNIYPGENINISANVTFKASADKASVKISAGSFDNANPMFGTLVPMEGSDKYVLCVSNGRNLQNLNAIAPKIANKIKTVAFTGDIDWNDTVTYYNDKASNGSYVNDSTEAPARSLPYFVPIHNEKLFGTAQFVYPAKSSSFFDRLKEAFNNLVGSNLFNLNEYVPTLTDELDTEKDSNGNVIARTHATVSGNGHKVLNIKIDSTRKDNNGNLYALGADFYAGKTAAANIDRFTGLFGYVNTSIDGLSVVNPVIKGGDFSGNNNPATGALVGAAGFNSLITNCSTYIDTSTDSGFNRGLLPSSVANQPDYDGDSSYGVKGSGAVGGLVGYAKSHRTVTGEMTGSKNTLAFSDSFAAIPVSGHMRGNADKHYGYTNGVGGLVGNAEISNFYNCYASGDVKADGVYVTNMHNVSGLLKKISDLAANYINDKLKINLFYNGRTCMGAGGFVGTSHGVRYTNCFASGDVLGTSSANTSNELKSKGTAGFAGIMSYGETKAYGNDNNATGNTNKTKIAQQTVFQNCYAAGLAKMSNENSENFSGANCRIEFDNFSGTTTKYWAGSFYEVYAPTWFSETGTKIKTIKYKNDAGEEVSQKVELLPYESFIYKDSYYISKYVSDNQDETNACADPVTYDNLTDLTGMQNSSTWITGQLNDIKKLTVSTVLNGIVDAFKGGSEDDDSEAEAKVYNYNGIYFGEWVNGQVDYRARIGSYSYSGPRYGIDRTFIRWGGLARNIIDDSVRYAGYTDKTIDSDNYRKYYANTLGNLSSIYEAFYHEGFPASNWDAGKSGNATHSYDTASVGAYPFTKLKSSGMEYYGRWASRSLACGLAYYEQYEDGSYGYYFDREATSTLRNDMTVVSDGYAILTANERDNITVTIGSKPYTLTSDGTYTATYATNNSVYYVHRLPNDALLKASDNLTFADFYALLTANINGQDYTLYFNPNVALSQINPSDNGKADNENSKYNAEEPTALPESIYIRTARQLAALSSDGMQKTVTNKAANFVQMIDIDAGTYTGNYNANKSVAQFNASYSGSGGYKEQASISGFENPIFKTIGADAKVSNLIVNCAGTHGGTGVTEAGLLASFNKGLVDNVDVTVASTASVKAETTAGLLIGVNSGTVSHCDATISAKATVTAGTNAGGIIGVNIGTVKNCTANITAKMTVTATNAGGFVGAALEGSKFENVTINGSDITGNGSVGAFAGYLEKTNANSVAVTVNGTVSATDTAAGFAASVKGGMITGSTVTIAEGAAVSAKSAAGLIGTANAADLSSLRLDLKGSVTGTDSAVGAVTKITSGKTNSVNVVLSGGTISADKDAAGFTLDAVTHIERSNVSGEGTISAANNAAGFAVSVSEKDVFNCVVSPADHTKTNLKNAYSARTLAALTISATGAKGNAAGFAVNVSGAITSCSALGTIDGTNAAGFAVKVANSGSINTSMANTDLVGKTGSPFAKTNTGFVANSYAWYFNGAAQEIEKNEDGQAAHYVSCYFAPFGSSAATPVTVVKVTKVEQIGYDDLAALEPEALGGEATVWQFAGKDDAYPFTNMGGAKYAYPMLHDHYGDWVNPTQYAYGVVYYEKSGDDIVSMNLVDLSVVNNTNAHPSFSLENLAGDGTTITETGYAVFYAKENPTQIIISGNGSVADYEQLEVTKDNLDNLKAGGEAATAKQIDDFYKTYSFGIWPNTKNAQTTQGIVINGIDGGKHMIVPAYADAIIKNWTAKSAAENAATYKIRTANQFANINADLGFASIAKGYEQTHSFTLSGNSDIKTFKSLSYNGNDHEITVGTISHGLFGEVSGTSNAKAEIKNVKLTGAVLNATKTAGIVADTVDEHSTITDVTLVKPRIEIEADYTKDNDTIAIGAVAGTNAGVITKINVETTKLTDIDGVVQKDDNGKDMYIPFVIDASKTTLKAATKDVPALNLNIGGLVGSNEGTLTVSNVKTDIEFTPVTAAPDADAEKTAFKQTVNFGGLAGYNTKTVKGDVTGDISLGSVALDNAGKEVTLTDDVKLGGLVGYSKSERDTKASVEGTVTGDISYTRPAVVSDDKDADVENKTVTDDVMLGGLVGNNHKGGTADASVTGTFNGKATKADEADKTIAIVKAEGENVSAPTKLSGTTYVGGLVGQMNGGSMSGGTASGAITVTGDETYVGGAIGYENSKATFNKVDTAVDIKGNWSQKADVVGAKADCPSGYANIGKFVGYVTSGKFTDCSATGASDLRLQFLGSIHKTSDTVSGNIYTSNVKSDAMGGNVTSLDSGNFDFIGAADGNKTVGFTKETDGTYYKFDAELNDCTYKSSKDGKVYTQYIENTKYFYIYAKVGSDHTQYLTGDAVTSFGDPNTKYVILDYTGKYALTTNEGKVEGYSLNAAFNKQFVDSERIIWTYEETNSKGQIKLRNDSSSRYLKVIWRALISDYIAADSDKGEGSFKLESAGNDFVHIRQYNNRETWAYCNGTSVGVEGSADENNKFKIYPITSSTKFENGTMTYQKFNRVCTSDEP